MHAYASDIEKTYGIFVETFFVFAAAVDLAALREEVQTHEKAVKDLEAQVAAASATPAAPVEGSFFYFSRSFSRVHFQTDVKLSFHIDLLSYAFVLRLPLR